MLNSVQEWCSSTDTEVDSASDPSSSILDLPTSPESDSFSFLQLPRIQSSPKQALANTPVMVMGALPLTPGGGISSPGARLLLSAMRPGWTLDPAAGVSTPYVQQLLRTLPVLTPETGGHTAWHPIPLVMPHVFYW